MTDSTTRDKLRDAAMRLYADRGVFQVSLAEIVRAAGQRNASAVHYHFGNRDQILVEILSPYAAVVRRRRLELLEAARPDGTVRPVVDAMVRPVVEIARLGWRERAYLRIGLEVADHPDQVGPEVMAVLNDTGAQETLELLAARCPALPADVLRWRLGICVGIVGRAAADRAQGTEDALAVGWSDDVFTAHLADVYLAVITGESTIAPARVRPRTH